MLGIMTNNASIIAQNAVANTQMAINTSVQRLSTGLKLNSAQDDPAGLGIAARMTAQVNGINQAVQNANYGVSLTQTAGGALTQVTKVLQQVRQLAVEAANASNSATDLAGLNTEAQQLISQVQTIATQTQFNGQNILDGTFGTATFQVGANAGQTLAATTGNSQTSAIGGYTAVGSAATGTALAGTGISITVNGVTTNTGATSDGQASTITSSINAVTNTTGVSATAATSILGSAIADGTTAISAGGVLINGTDIGAVAVGTGGTNAIKLANFGANVTAAINAVTATTGVTATFNISTSKITLSNTTGADIVVAGSSPGTAGLSAATTHGIVTTYGSSNFTLVDASTNSGLNGASVSLNALSAASLSTVSNATATISTVDGALAQVNSLAASIGAISARFQSAVATLQTQSQYLTQARSSVQDTNFAQTTAELSQEDVLQQAGTAMVAQANQAPSQVLTLLQKLA